MNFSGSPKSELQDICLVSDPEQAQQVVPEDHHSNPTNSRRGSIENPDVRPSLDIRRCSLDQTFSALNPNTDSLHNARRASIDNGLIINNIRSTLDQTGYHAVDSYGHQAGDMLPVNLDPECSFSASVVTSAPVASMSIAPVDSTHVTYSQQLASGVQSLPPSGPPSVQADPRYIDVLKLKVVLDQTFSALNPKTDSFFTMLKPCLNKKGKTFVGMLVFLIQSATSYKKIKKRASQKSFDPFYFVGALELPRSPVIV